MLSLSLNLGVINTPAISIHQGHGQREGNYDSTPALQRLIVRKAKQNPLGLAVFIVRNAW
jgi:hypothetical protein